MVEKIIAFIYKLGIVVSLGVKTRPIGVETRLDEIELKVVVVVAKLVIRYIFTHFHYVLK